VTRTRRATPRPRLRELADRLGILPEYLDQTGRHIIRTTDEAREALLSVMRFDAPTEDAAIGWLAELDHEERQSIIDPVRVVERDDRTAMRVQVRLPHGVGTADVQLTLTEEQGHEWTVRQTVRRAATLVLPTRPSYGYHTIVARIRAGAMEWSADQSFIVVPSSCVTPEMLGPRASRSVGVVANLYSVRREHDWGVGDLTTLMQLVEWSASRGASFVGVNPLHALFNRGMDISPYSPVSRLFRNPIYIDVEAVPELSHSEEAGRMLLRAREALQRLRLETLVDYDRVIALKLEILRELHRAFSARDGGERSREFADFVRRQEPELTRHATWAALAESTGVPDWRQWPASLHHPDDPAVEAYREAHREIVDFHRWLQFESSRQLADVAGRARALRMPIGVYQDLAIGTNAGGSDAWSNPELFLSDASIGAPPDPYSSTGQVWGIPPMDPRALRKERYRYWIQLLRRAFEHAGALRIDHVMGLFRMFWITAGGTGLTGAYVKQNHHDLLGILALESIRHDALVVGEDLGTVPKTVPPALLKWGILSSKVLLFEKDRRGYKPAKRYPRLSLATANTHDMPTLPGFWAERDIELRERVGLLRTSEEVGAERRERVRDKEALLRLLRLAPPREFEREHFSRRLAGAVHDFLCDSPAMLVGVSYADLIGEVNPVNVPGVGPDRYPSWRQRTRMTLEETTWSFEVDDTFRCSDRRKPE
jgi:4-alpha-glucanotransferase